MWECGWTMVQPYPVETARHLVGMLPGASDPATTHPKTWSIRPITAPPQREASPANKGLKSLSFRNPRLSERRNGSGGRAVPVATPDHADTSIEDAG